MSDQSTGNTVPKKRKRLFWLAAVLLLFLVIAGFATPWIIANTGLRDRLINAIMGTPNLTASTKAASFGWFSPLRIEEVEITGKLNRFRVDVENLTAARSWPMLLVFSPDLGTITVEKPHAQLILPLGERGSRSTIVSPTFTAEVHDAALTVQTPEVDGPIIDVDGIDLTLHIDKAGEDRVLTLDPVDIFTRRKLTTTVCSRLLQLISPALNDATHVDGEYSLTVNKLRIPIGVPEDQLIAGIELEGELALHKVSMEAEGPMLQAIGKVLADLYGLEMPETIRVVKDTEIKFQARDGRLFHEGLQLGLPDIDPALQVKSWGSVGLDETLDLHLEVPRLDAAKRTESGPVACHITGTIHDPRLSAKDASLVIRLPNYAEPLIDVDGVDLVMRVEDSPAGHVLAVDPVQVLDREKIDRQLASSFLHLIEPDLRYSPELLGEVSLAFDTLRIPLERRDEGWAKQLEIRGKMVIHQIATVAKDPLRQAIVKLLADLYDKEPKEIVRISQDTEVDFHLHDGRLHYSGLCLGFPNIDPALQVVSQGSVGLDETLDLQVEIPRLDKAKFAERGPVLCHVTGTVSCPRVSIKDASLVVRSPNSPEALIDVDGVDLSMQVEESPTGPILTVDPFDVLKREKISTHLTSALVHLIAPGLRDSPEMSGEVSLSVDKVEIPLGRSKDQWLKQAQVDGHLTLHQVTSRIHKPMRLALVKLLADLYGKDASEVVRLAQDTDVEFHLRDGRVHYQGLKLGFPDIDPALQVDSRGSLGLDETVDIVVDLPRLDKAKLAERGPVHCRISGSLDNPKLSLKDGSLVVRLPGYDQPVLDVDGIDLAMSVETEKDVPMLVFAPTKVLDRQELTAGLIDELLALVAPTLGDVADIRGAVSLSLDRFRVPLGVSKEQFIHEVELAGRLQLHDISTSVETPLLSAMVKVLADLYDKTPSEVVRVVKNADVSFEVKEERLFHEGLRIGFPDISPELLVTSRGSVGLDKSLDLVLEMPAVLAKVAEGTPSDLVRFRITGTIDSPNVVELEE